MSLRPRTLRAALAALAVALIAAPVAHASATYGPAMSAAQIRAMQGQGIREIILARQPGLSAVQRAELRAQAGLSYIGPGPLPNTEIDRAPAGRLGAAVAVLRHDPHVRYAEPNGEVHAASTPNDTYFGSQWALSNTGQSVNGIPGTPGDDIGATYAWAHSTGAGITVAVVDTGVDATAQDLQGQLVVPGASFLGGVQGTDTQDQNGHGTHVSGIIAAAQNNHAGVSGVAPGARVTPLRVLDANGSGSLYDVASAFDYAGNHNIRIVNASLGGPAASQTLEQAIANHPNTLYVVAAGNNAANNDAPGTPFYPCDLPDANLICVGASDQNDQPAYFSNYGGVNVDLFAPGVNIASTWPAPDDYRYASGTSMAAPMVTGTLALMLAHNPSLTAAELKSDLLSSVDQAPQLAGLAASGGELDAAAAVATAGSNAGPDAPYAAPGNRGLPEVSGAPTVGVTLTASPGSWSRLPTAYTYQWQRCLLGVCLPIAGATSASYTLAASDYGAAFDVLVSAGNAAGTSEAISAVSSTVDLARPASSSAPSSGPSPSAGAVTTAPTPAAPPPAPGLNTALRLTRVALVGKPGPGRGQRLVFTLSAQARVQITVARSDRGRGAAGDVLHLALSAHTGPNRYALTSLLRGHRLARGQYALTVRAASRTVTLRLTV